MTKILAALLLTSALSAPAFAQMASDDMSCAEFVALDASAQMKAMEMMAEGEMAHDGEMMAEGEMESDGEMMAEGEMESDGEKMAEGEMASDGEMMAEGEMASDGEMMAEEDHMTVEGLVTYCNDHPDMKVADAMMEEGSM